MRNIILRNQKGVSFIELLIVMTLVVIVLMMNTDTLGVIFRHSRQQAQAVGAQMDRVVGLEMLRTDLEHAGFGLPWFFQGPINYTEATDAPQTSYNDAPLSPPRAIMSGNDPSTFTLNNSDYLVIKSTNVGTSETSQRWTHIIGNTPHTWESNNLVNNDRIIIMRPQTSTTFNKTLIMDDTTYSIRYSEITSKPAFLPSANQRYIIYGVDPNTDLTMPFNRADYFIQRPASIPQACALNTGILYKATLNQSNGRLINNPFPLIDCVADMQVIFQLDTNGDGIIDSQRDTISTLNAQEIREQLKEVRVYILSHEGERDKAFKYQPTTINPHFIEVGEFGLGRVFNLTTIPNWENYRWKVSTLVVKPRNLSS